MMLLNNTLDIKKPLKVSELIGAFYCASGRCIRMRLRIQLPDVFKQTFIDDLGINNILSHGNTLTTVIA
jgi:hypothetical protein